MHMGNVIEPIKEGPQAPENGRLPFKGLKGSLVVGLSLLLSLSAHATSCEIDGIEWTYRKIDNGRKVEIRGAHISEPAIDRGTRGFVTVPDKIRSTTVSRIGHNAFNGCRRITGITIPDGVTYVGTNAFGGCRLLQEATVNGKITEIRAYTFDGCTSLERVSFPDTVKKIGMKAFKGCKSLVDIGELDNVESIGEEAFRYCHSLTNVVLPEGLKSLGAAAFFGCESLASVSIPDSATDVSLYAFYLCNSLKTLEVGSGNPVYSSRNNIMCDKAGGEALICAPGLLEADIPEGVTNVVKFSFERCRPLQKVNIPDSVVCIEESAFWGCESLQSVTVPKNVRHIGAGAFAACGQLSEIKVAEENPRYSVRNGLLCNKNGTEVVFCPEGLKEVEIPEGVVGISQMAFGYNENIEKVVIPDSVVYIGYCAFGLCDALAEVHISERYSGPMDVFPAAATIIRYSPVSAVADDALQGRSRIAEALDGYADVKLAECISNATQYAVFKDWLDRSADGFIRWFKDSSNAKFAYVLDARSSFDCLPRSEDLRIDGFERIPSSGVFDFSVSAGEIYVGDHALLDDLKTLFCVEGSAGLHSGGFSPDNVEVEFDSPVDGKVKIKATPKDGSPRSFFFRVRMRND